MSLHWTEADYQAHLQRTRAVEGLYLGSREYAGLVSEKAFMQAVVRLAKQHGYLVYHTFNAKRSPEGFPDLVCVHPTERERPVLAWELKTTTGQVTPAQQAWVAALGGRQVVSAVWRPGDWPQIQEALRR